MRLILVLLTLISIQAPQSGSIDGTVVRYGTTDGISRAKVTLAPVGSGTQGQAVIVESDGKFSFRNLAAGQYRISASHDGFVNSEYGQRGPNGAGVAITLAAQQHATDIRIGMTATGGIGGRVVNRFGEPVGNANVQALRYTYQDGRRVLNTVQTAHTDDRGEYRLFWMNPGQYLVSAQPAEQLNLDSGGTMSIQTARAPGGVLSGPGAPQLGVGGVTRITISGGGPGDFVGAAGPGGAPPPMPPLPPIVDNPETYLTVYYPGTTEVGAAMPIDLRAGGNVEGINLTVADVRPVRVRGQVLSGGRPASGAQVSIYPRNNANGSLTVRGTSANDMGFFEFRNVAPGAYEVAATVNGAGPGVMLFGTPLGAAAGLTTATVVGGRGGRNPGQPVMAGRVTVDVSTANIDGVALVLETGFNVAGKVIVEGTTVNDSAASLNGVRIQLQSDPLIPQLAIVPVNPEADGAFSITGVTSGTYRLTVSGLPHNTYIKSARFLGNDILSNGMRVDGEPRGSLDIALGSTPGSLDAVVMDYKQMPEAAVTVILAPDTAQQKRTDLYRSATSDSSGKVHWDGVAPGDYKIFAFEDIESGAGMDPEFMKAYDGLGKSVHIDDRGRANVEVRVIPYKAN